MTAVRDRFRMGLLGCVLTVVSLAAIGLVVLLMSVAAASIPALIYASIVLRLDRYEIEPLRAVLACFTWGAVGAVLFSVATGLLFQYAVEEVLGTEIAAAVSV